MMLPPSLSGGSRIYGSQNEMLNWVLITKSLEVNQGFLVVTVVFRYYGKVRQNRKTLENL